MDIQKILNRLEFYKTLESTQEALKKKSSEQTLSFFDGIWTLEQTRGRGRGNHTWQSPPGGLALSVFLPEPQNLEAKMASGLVLALALLKTLGDFSFFTAKIKWPNDLWVGNKKIAGVLCESFVPSGMIAGIGFNLNNQVQDFLVDLQKNLTTLFDETAKKINAEHFVQKLMVRIVTLWPVFQNHGLEKFHDEISKSLAFRGENVSVRFEDDVTKNFVGIFKGLGPLGECLIEDPSGEIHVLTFGEIRPS